MLTFIDNYLNKTTMYRLVLYVLIALLAVAAIFGFCGWLPYGGMAIIFSTLVILIVCWIANELFAWLFKAPKNVESVYVTALILALIISPLHSIHDGAFWSLALWASGIAMASKYIFAIGKKHIFNPAAFAVAVTALTINQAASWWVGTAVLAPFVLVLGLLVVRKIRRADLVLTFLVVSLAIILSYDLTQGFALWGAIKAIALDTPIMFFAFIMLTEPLTTPPTRKRRIAYGALTGVLYLPFLHIFNIESTPELALAVANIFSYLISPKQKLMLTLKKRTELTPDTHDFAFESDKHLPFRAGQYLEWTLAHEKPDSRGNRRYFTIASAPSEMGGSQGGLKEIHMGVKFYDQSSSFKEKLLSMKAGERIVASQLAGDFVLPHDASRKLVFIAGGIGITPFVSMIREMLHEKKVTGAIEPRDITLFYSNKTERDIAYRDLFDRALRELGIKVVHTLAGGPEAPSSWKGERGFINEKMIRAHLAGSVGPSASVSDLKQYHFYISGPQAMVASSEKMLEKAGVHRTSIKKDFFPGFA